MAIGRISGSVLKANLTRNGTDLAFETNLLYLDVTNSRIGIGTSSPATELDVDGTITGTTVTAGTLTASGTGTSALLTLTTTEASASASPIIALKRNSGSPADSDKLGQLSFLGENDNDQEVEYARIYSSIFDASDGTEDGKIQVQVMKAGTLSNSMRFESEGIFLNTSNTIIFEGGTADNYETTLTVIDPTADHTVSLPNVTGTLVPGKIEGTNFTDSLMVGHATTGSLTGADRNTIVGIDAMKSVTGADDNTVVGYIAGERITTGSNNVLVGKSSGDSLTTSANNTGLGFYSLAAGVTGVNYNTAIGHQSQKDSTGQEYNTSVGHASLQIVTGDHNIGIGSTAGDNITSGSGNIIIGSNIDADSATGSRQLKIAGYDGATTTTWITGASTGAVTISGAYSLPTSDGAASTFLQTDGSGALTFAEAGGGGGGNNTAVKQFNYYKLTTTSAVIDEFDLDEYRGAVYDITMEDHDNSLIGHIKVSVVHNDSTPYISVYDVNEDSTNIVNFTAAISGDMLQLSGSTQSSTHTNLRIYRIALGDHHETVANTNSKIIATSTSITTAGVTLDQFTKTDIQGAKYVVLFKDSTQTEYQISEVSLTHNGTTVYFNDYAKVSTRSDYAFTLSSTISSATLTLTAASTGGTSATAILYRQDLGSKTKLGEFDNTLYGKKSDIDSTVETIDSFDVFKYKTASYFINIGHSGDTAYQNSEITLTVNSAGSGATISESVVRTGTSDLATFTADVSGGKARLRMQGTSANNVIYFARLGMEAKNIYRANAQTSDDLYIKHSNIIGPSTLDSKTIMVGKSEGTNFTGSLLVGHNTTGTLSSASQNTGIGLASLDAITAGDNCTAVGYNALTTMTTGTHNTAVGRYALSTVNNSHNTAVGTNAQKSATGSKNTSLGEDALDQVTGNSNIAIGYQAGDNITSGDGNVVIGKADVTATGDDQLSISDGEDGAVVWITGDSSGNITIAGNLTVSGSVTSASTSDSDDTTTGDKTSIGTSATNINTFTTSTYDSAFYLAVTRDEINEEVACDQISLVHNNTTAFVASGGGVRSGDNDHITYTADINSGTVRLRGTGTSDVNSIKFFRIGLGDDTSGATTGKATTVLNADVDSAVENLDTWAHASYRGAKYYISANNTGKTELQNIECMVVHNGTDAFITTYNDVYTGNNALIALTADISGSDVRLRVSGNEANTAVKLYRILLADDESGATGTNTNIIGATTISSSATTLDSFSSDSYTGVHYIVVGYNSGESGTPGSISEVFTVTDGSGAWVSNSQISTKGTDQVAFTAALSGSTVTLSAASTSGGSTTLNAYRVHMLRGIAGASTSIQVLTSNDQAITGTKTLSDNVKLKFGTGGDLEIYHDGSNSYIDDAGTGNILYRSGTQTFQNAAGSKTMAVFNASNSVDLNYNNTTRLQTSSTGVTVAGAVAMGVVSDPSTVANYAHVYAKDDTASAEVYVRDEAGNVTKLSPHNKQGEWEYFSRNTITGKTVRVNMEEMIKDIEKLTGKKYIKND